MILGRGSPSTAMVFKLKKLIRATTFTRHYSHNGTDEDVNQFDNQASSSEFGSGRTFDSNCLQCCVWSDRVDNLDSIICAARARVSYSGWIDESMHACMTAVMSERQRCEQAVRRTVYVHVFTRHALMKNVRTCMIACAPFKTVRTPYVVFTLEQYST